MGLAGAAEGVEEALGGDGGEEEDASADGDGEEAVVGVEGVGGGPATRKRLLPAARTTRLMLWVAGRVSGGVEIAAMVEWSWRLGRGMMVMGA